jgi:hypothetical protein
MARSVIDWLANDKLSEIQAKLNAAVERLKTTNDPVKRRELLVAVRMLIAALEKFIG